jgi:hypothetical protein
MLDRSMLHEFRAGRSPYLGQIDIILDWVLMQWTLPLDFGQQTGDATLPLAPC